MISSERPQGENVFRKTLHPLNPCITSSVQYQKDRTSNVNMFVQPFVKENLCDATRP